MVATGAGMGRRLKTLLFRSALALTVLLAAGGLYLNLHRYVPPQAAVQSPFTPPRPAPDDLSWNFYGGDAAQTRQAAIRQIDPSNVAHLQQAWIYRTGETGRRGRWVRHGKFQNTPILAAGNLVVCSPFNRVIALDPVTGRERWVYDPHIEVTERPDERFNCRGLARWQDEGAGSGAGSGPGSPPDCRERLFMATTDRRIIALDAATGLPCPSFGAGGEVRIGLERADLREGELQFASAPAVVGDVLVVGSASGDNGRAFGPAGVVRAFDVRSGEERWAFDPIPRAYDPVASPTWEGDSASRTGQANVWGSITVDEARDLVFLPTSSPSPDYFGGLRKGDNLYANSMVALRGSSGKVVWHFQTVHHDIWDYDLPAGPSLIEFRPRRPAADAANAAPVPALVFATKTGFLFVLHRETGQPLTEVEERPVPKSDVPGEWTSPTQPWSVGLPTLSPQGVTPDDAFGLMLFDKAACREAIRSSRNEGLFTPPATGAGTLLAPMGAGGANWGGLAVDTRSNRVFVNTNNALHRVTLLPPEEAARRRGQERGKEISLMRGAPYGMIREVLMSPIGLPCNKPPWGKLAAVDLESGRLAWEVTLGNTRKLAPLGLSLELGTPNFGAPILTGGGVLFIGATMDNLLRAFDPQTGRELWAGDLPYGAHATPMTYAVGGRQYVVIAAGGHPVLGSEIGDAVVAFALPVQ